MSGLGFTHWSASVAVALGISFCTIDYASAQITPDGTLPNNSSVTREGNTFNITGGTQAGGNLFHSFGEFSVNTGGTASFNNAVDIQNIISRVTGGSISNIDGLIQANGTANLFLINPNGIVFGENAQLNVGGSFVATSANALQFGNQGFFSATDKNIPSPLLTINPSALLFNQINQNAAIQNNSVAFAGTDPAGFNAFGLRVPNGKSLLLVGGNVSMDGGQLNAYGGRVELGGLAELGTVALGVDGDNLSLIFPDNVARTSVFLTNQAAIYVEGAGGGNIAVNARNLEILGGSFLSGGIGRNLGTPETVAGDIMLNVTREIQVGGRSGIANIVRLGSLGNGGNITIDSGSFSLRDGAQLVASTYGQGNAANVTVRAKNAVSLADAYIFSTVESGGVGKGGNIDINAATLSLIDGAQLATATRDAFDNTQLGGRGNAGNVNVRVTGAVEIAGRNSGIFSSVGTETVGNGGNITIDSGSFSLQNSAEIAALTYGQGNAGNVTVSAKDAVFLADASILSTVQSGGVGNGGNINITAVKLSLIDGAQLLTITRGASASQPAGRGDAGDVDIKVSGAVNIAGQKNGFISAIASRVETGTVGNGGNITIDSGSFSLQNGARLSASTYGKGNAGNVTVSVKDAVDLADGSIFSTVESGGVGNGGNININAATLSLTDSAQLQTIIRRALFVNQLAGRGDAGNVNIQVSGAVNIAGQKNGFLSFINSSVETGTVGNGGNIIIDSGSFSLQNGARLSASTSGKGNAGNVTVSAKDVVDLADADIFSMVESEGVGKGGNIDINAATLLLTDGAQLSASTFGQGNAGNVTVSAKDAVDLADADIFSTVEAGGVGKGGNIGINAKTLSLIDGAQLLTLIRQASTTQPAGRGDAGNVNVNVTGAVDITGEKNGFPSGISSRVETGTIGSGGNITINSGLFSLLDGALLTAETLGLGNAGTIKVNAATQVNISGKSSNNSGLFVNSQSRTGTAGDIIVTSPRITLDNSGTLNAESASGNGGDINLEADLLLLRRGAQISTTAGTAEAGGDGGNISINAPSGFIIAVPNENSDIAANAFTGAGGRVNIKANGIYGIKFRESPTPLSDITASSQFGTQATVELNTLGIDPNSGLVELPRIGVETEVAQVCDSPGYAQSSFIITGRGGLPPNPTKDILAANTVEVGWISPKPSSNANSGRRYANNGLRLRSNPPVTSRAVTTTSERIVEASGWALNEKGEVVLTANVPAEGRDSWQKDVPCSVSQAAHQ
ncbi:filamentous hemagglutinin N-terminal domain-containing protein [Nostoc flagelliforme FACHB-838]|uniref:Filamentous hemagglutinin N-terminal domain-containing protein n=1 Tax=Nostoc flagelliforme FACHB-838 TaxID=2692904 RepID=A0ABR8E154_9NOSO|nr:filamentous hemagglutinin N-terminal domain-containing protein [Nostoc flagelliforme]MBD2535326.1 filamentous hemagglutinin N-terminal domain-containing protein [Nostoc flagelliforme FACHB-838]